ncbi:VanZ family protein [Brachybacterium kimchii]|uniref:VanZ family protein n=1 Tax=Brachybacterium kimchii TaxID=2942909 RepID=A0ABY4N267_9MICO|nr:VanZ family protein [Brachybacterium kimchii]UQN28186.1 VanZ family protein [Brachybacterium kimchii]
MSDWTWQIPFSVIGGGVLFVGLLVPILVLQYRRYGRLSVLRLLGAAAVSVYGVALVAYTLLPLPDPARACGEGAGRVLQVTPFQFVADIVREGGGLGLREAVTSWAVLQAALNVVLFVPLGLAVRGMLRRGVLAATALGALVSLAIETTQYTGLWGIYDCSYRIADIDDLLLNTAGALVGALLAPLLLHWWMPSPEQLTARRSHRVSGLRRLLGMVVDLIAVGLVGFLFDLGRAVVELVFATDARQIRELGEPGQAVLLVLAFAVVFALPALGRSGASIGQRAVGIAPAWPRGSGGVRARLLRASAVGGVWTVGRALALLLSAAGVPLASGALSLAIGLYMLVVLVFALVGDHRGLSGRLAGNGMVDARALTDAGVTARERSTAA